MNNELTGPDIVLLIEALDMLLFSKEGGWIDQHAPESHERTGPYHELRNRLKQAVHMSWYDRASGWLDSELARERIALSDQLFTALCEVLRQPKATPRSVREAYVAANRELREHRQSQPRPLS